MQHWSLVLDLSIALQTMYGGVGGKNAC